MPEEEPIIFHLFVLAVNISSRAKFYFSSENFIQKQLPEVHHDKGVLKYFAKLTGKHMCRSERPATLLQKRLRHTIASRKFCEVFRSLL